MLFAKVSSNSRPGGAPSFLKNPEEPFAAFELID